MNRALLAFATSIGLVATTFADTPEALPDGASVISLDVRPTAIDLTTPYAYRQLIVTAKLASGDAIDATRFAKLTPPSVVTVSPTGIVRPVADGKGELTIAVADKTARISVSVSGSKAAYAVSFVKDVQPTLSKLGCNAGTCHGAQAGKNGFKLSLRGYDAVYDHRALTDDLEGRRFNRAAPERSLMLLKPAGAVPHVGGVTMAPGDPAYELIRTWIAAGVQFDPATPRVTAIELFPKNPTISRIGAKQQFAVIATYADGSTRDVSAEAFLDSSNTEVTAVDKTGLLTTVRRGESTVLARYEGAYAASTVIVTGDRSGFAWKQLPVNNFIDELVDAKLKKVKVPPSDVCSDADFIRRVYIDLTGLPPSATDVREFLTNNKPTKEKRDALVVKLVASDAFVEYWTNKWADLLQVNRKFLGDPGATALRKWIRDAIAKNMPYDQFAHAILTASGSNVENPPAAYYKVLRLPDAIMENTTQLFLAVRFNCNKCHDHPFEKWTQEQYYSLAAYFAQVTLKEDPKFKGQKLGGTAVENPKPLAEIVGDGPTPSVVHERGDKPTPPAFPFTYASAPAKDLSRRAQVAQWITAKDNPYFAKSYVNRLWSYLLGVGIIEPVDDIRAGNPPTNPELLDRLTAEFVGSQFDTRKLLTAICQSRTYQLSIATTPWNKDDDINYSHALPRRLPAEVLFDAIHAATGSQTRLPGLPAGARAAQLLDSNVDLPGGFLELFGKPVRESACECERSNTMMLGPVLAMVNGPIVADAIKDPAGYLAKVATETKDDAKLVEEIYLAVLNRFPTATEKTNGVAALKAAGPDFDRLTADHRKKVDAFKSYETSLDDRQKAWEEGLKSQKPTTWTVLEPKTAISKAGPTPAGNKDGSTLKIQADKSILVTGKIEANDLYTIATEAKIAGTISAIRLEVLPDPVLPAKGPGRAENGNFVLNEFKLTHQTLDKSDDKPKPIKLQKPKATFEQGGFPIANAIDNNVATGWAIFGGTGNPQTAIFEFAPPLAADKGVLLTATLDQRFGTGHTIGKFRLAVTTDKAPKLTASVTPETAVMLETPSSDRTPEVKSKLRAMYLGQDQEYQRLQRDASTPPPAAARVLGAQDLAWALINSPAFLFNH